MRTRYTGTFDGLSEDYLTRKQKAALTLNEDAREVFQKLAGCKVSITIDKYREGALWTPMLISMCWSGKSLTCWRYPRRDAKTS